MDERESYSAFRILNSTARAFLATVEQAIGRGTSAKISKRDFEAVGISRGASWSVAKTRLIRLKFITVEAGAARGVARANTYSLSDRWRELDEAQAKQLAKVARRRVPRTVMLMRLLARAAEGNAEARSLLRKHVHEPDPYALADVARLRPDLFAKAGRAAPGQPRRRSFADDVAARKIGERARPAR